MNFIKYFFIFLFLLLIASFNLQSQVKDAAFWTGMKISKRFTKRISSRIFMQERLAENFTHHSNFFFDIGVVYKLSRNLNATLAYVYIDDNTSYENPHNVKYQYYLDLHYTFQYYKFIFRYRPIVQFQYGDYFLNETFYHPSIFLRSKMIVKYELTKKITPFAFIEPRWQFNHFGRTSYDRLRSGAGINYQLNRKNDFDFYYMIQAERDRQNPLTTYLIGINYNFSL